MQIHVGDGDMHVHVSESIFEREVATFTLSEYTWLKLFLRVHGFTFQYFLSQSFLLLIWRGF